MWGDGRAVGHRILQVSRFGVLQMVSSAGGDVKAAAAAAGVGGREAGGRVVDILAEGVEGDWSPSTHLNIIKVLRYALVPAIRSVYLLYCKLYTCAI